MGCSPSKEDRPLLAMEDYVERVARPPKKPRKSLNPFGKPPVPQIIISRTPDPRTRISPTMTAYDVRVFGRETKDASANDGTAAPKKVHFASRHTTMTFGSITSTLEIPVVKYGDASNIALSNADSPHRLGGSAYTPGARGPGATYAAKPYSGRADSVAHVDTPASTVVTDTVVVTSSF